MTKTLQTVDNEFLTDHVIGGNPVLPTVCAIAWMSNAAESLFTGYRYQGLENYKLFKGVVFDGTQATDYAIDLEVKSEDLAAGSFVTTARISSTSTKGKPVFHYAADLHLVSKRAAPLADAKLQATEIGLLKQASSTASEQEAKALYSNGTLFHGESLQGIEQIITCDDKGLLLRCLTPKTASVKQGDFSLAKQNIFANDLVYQAMLVWVRRQLSMGSLPSSTKAWTVYGEVQADEEFYLKLDVVEQADSKLIADIALINSKQQLLAQIKSAEVTVSKSLNDLFVTEKRTSQKQESKTSQLTQEASGL